MVLLPGPEIGDRTLSKVRELARQVTRANERFLATKILDRAAIFNVYTQNLRKSRKQNPADENIAEGTVPGPDGSSKKEEAADPVTPFPQYAHHYGHSFEAVGKFRLPDVDHAALIHGKESGVSGDWFPWLSNLFNVVGFRKS